MRKPKHPRIGLMPFYLKLYDDLMPARRHGFDTFIERICSGLSARGVDVVRGPICRIAEEFGPAVEAFEAQPVDAIVTLHLAYSPSLESIDAFCRSRLPLILLDSTMDADFGLEVKEEKIMGNHGVHGVMDFACMLRRRERPFEIVAGHDSDPSLLDRVACLARAAVAAREFQGTKALRVAPAFKGMGDFSVEESTLRERFGITVKEVDIKDLDQSVSAVSDEAVEAEMNLDRERYDCDLEAETHRRSVRVGLGLRGLLETGGYGAMSVNFQAFDGTARPAETMPFLEISKAMSRGIGYGGEGDILTASLVGALARAFGQTTFTEIFCADWQGGALFLSHMGEISPAVAEGKARLFEKPFFIKGVPAPAVLNCSVKPGPAVLVNLAPGPADSFSLIVSPVDVLAESSQMDPAMRNAIRAWVKPRRPVAEFLECYSRAGGTHHSALVLGNVAEAICAFGRQSGMQVVNI